MAAEPRKATTAFQDLLERIWLTDTVFEFTYSNGVVGMGNKNTIRVTLYLGTTRQCWHVFLSSAGFLRMQRGPNDPDFIAGPHASRFRDSNSLASWLVRTLNAFNASITTADPVQRVYRLTLDALPVYTQGTTLFKHTARSSGWVRSAMSIQLEPGMTVEQLDASIRAYMELD